MTVGRELSVGDGAAVAGEGEQQAAFSDVPDLELAVLGAGEEVIATL